MFRPRNKPPLRTRLKNLVWPKLGFRRFSLYVGHRLSRIRATPHVIALGFAAGAFASFTPFVGFHFFIGAILAAVIGGNVVASALGTCVGNPISFPFIWLSTYNLGGYLLGYDQRNEIDLSLPDGTWSLFFRDLSQFWEIFWGAIEPVVKPMLLGSIPLGLICGAITYFAIYALVEGYQRRRRERLARRRIGRRDVSASS